MLPRRGDDHGAAVLRPLRPAEIEAPFRKRGSDRSGDVWPPFGPIEARSTEITTGRIQRGKVDSELGEKSGARLRDFSGFFAEHNVLARSEEVGQVDAETTGKVVVADPGRAKLACLTRHRAVSRPVFERNGDDALDHLYDFRRCELEIPMPSLSDHPHQARFGQLGEMRARRLRGDPSRVGKLARGQGSAIEKRQEYRGSCTLPDEPCDFGKEIARNHLPYIAPEPVGRADEHFDSDRSGRTLIRS